MTATATSDAPVHLLVGDDAALLSDALVALVHELVGDGDRAFMVEELTEDNYRTDAGFDIARLVDAAQTAPFLTDRRVVIGRHLARFSRAEDLAPLYGYLDDVLPTTSLVLVWERGESPKQDRLAALPKKLSESVRAARGVVTDTAIPSGKQADAWLDERLSDAAVKFDRAARARIAERLGEDRSRVVGLLHVLEAAFGRNVTVSAADVEPFLGEAGTVPPWELTDAIDRGDIAAALDRLHRMTGAGERHPLALLATLHTHYSRMLRLDGVPGLDEKAAAARLGMKGSTFPAKKALTQTKRLGSDKVATAIGLLADADLALRGAIAWPPDLVMEVLVARLARLGRR
ncbi:MAG TPA: DNA polymerase III subunit delta [Acidimicrobiales bacterium]|nr:DNA polymerase III subunit delta [Acidimicrobiales bacterium]